MMRVINEKYPLALIEQTYEIKGVQDILDLIVNANYSYNCNGLIVYEKSLGNEFFDLKTKYAGEILQKFSNYNMKLAIIGEFDKYNSKALRDFIYECNHGKHIFFKTNLEEAVEILEMNR